MQEGDIVRIKGLKNSPVMKVSALQGFTTRCYWFTEDQMIQSENFPSLHLELVTIEMKTESSRAKK